MAATIDWRSGFCAGNGIFYSKREFLKLPEDLFLTLPLLIFQRPLFDASAIAYIDAHTGHTLSYGDLRSQVQCAAAGLLLFGVKPGDVVLVLCPNCIAFPVIMLAIMSMGAIITTTNPLNTPMEIAKQVADSGAVVIASLPSLLLKLPKAKLPVILLPELEEGTQNIDNARDLGFPRSTTFAELLHTYSDVDLQCRSRQDDIAALLYSSGTTGTSKGVMLTHRNLIAQAHFLLQGEIGLPWTSRKYLGLLPMFHVYGMGFFASMLLAKGSTVVLQRRFNIEQILEAVQKYRITHMPVVPPILVVLAKVPGLDKYDLSSLVDIGCGAAPLSKDVVDAFHARFPKISLRQGYGLTESTAVGAYTVSEEESKHHGSAGFISGNSEAKIVCIDSGKPLPPNQKGEIWIRGPCVMKGYLGRPGETAATIDKEGWLHTGDLGYIDEQGYLYIVDRLKELIKYKGFQVAPAEVEAVLLSNPKIVDAAVTGYPDIEAGQIPMAFVVKDPQSSLTEVEVMDFVAGQVAPYKRVRRVAMVESIPKTASGKIIRRQLVTAAISKL